MTKNMIMTALALGFVVSVGGAARADNAVEKRIETRLEKDKLLKEHKINVDVDDQGIATLKGSVSTGGEKARAEQLAHVKGVSRIENDISVAVPDSDLGNEDQARGRPGRRGDHRFVDHGQGQDPVRERGRSRRQRHQRRHRQRRRHVARNRSVRERAPAGDGDRAVDQGGPARRRQAVRRQEALTRSVRGLSGWRRGCGHSRGNRRRSGT